MAAKGENVSTPTARPCNSTPGCSSSFAHKLRNLRHAAGGGAPCTAGYMLIDDVLDYTMFLHFTEQHDLTLLFSSLLSQSESWCAYCPTDYQSLGRNIKPQASNDENDNELINEDPIQYCFYQWREMDANALIDNGLCWPLRLLLSSKSWLDCDRDGSPCAH